MGNATSCLYADLSGFKIRLNLVKILYKTTMKIVMKDIFWSWRSISSKKLLDIHNDLPFLTDKKVEKLAANSNEKNARNLQQAWNHTLFLKKVYRVTKFSQQALLKPCIDINIELKIQKLVFKNIVSSWWIMQFSKIL